MIRFIKFWGKSGSICIDQPVVTFFTVLQIWLRIDKGLEMSVNDLVGKVLIKIL